MARLALIRGKDQRDRVGRVKRRNRPRTGAGCRCAFGSGPWCGLEKQTCCAGGAVTQPRDEGRSRAMPGSRDRPTRAAPSAGRGGGEDGNARVRRVDPPRLAVPPFQKDSAVVQWYRARTQPPGRTQDHQIRRSRPFVIALWFMVITGRAGGYRARSAPGGRPDKQENTVSAPIAGREMLPLTTLVVGDPPPPWLDAVAEWPRRSDPRRRTLGVPWPAHGWSTQQHRGAMAP